MKKKSFKKGVKMAIKLVKIRKESMIHFGEMKRGDRVTRAQLASLERNVSDRLNQNEARRTVGVERAGQYIAK